MGQKVNPHGMRVGVIKDWDSRWYASEEKVGDLIVEDQKIRKYLKETLFGAGVPKVEIERSNEVVTIYLHCARPGVVIGKGGEQIEQYRLAVEKMIGKEEARNLQGVMTHDELKQKNELVARVEQDLIRLNQLATACAKAAGKDYTAILHESER